MTAPPSRIATALVLSVGATAALAAPAHADARSIVLVHGAMLDGSGWRAVHDRLKADGYEVGVVQMPLTSLEEDVAATRRVMERIDGPVILVGHSYGGIVITQAGDDPDVAGLVYVAALQPDVGEGMTEVSALAEPVGDPDAVIPTEDGFLAIDPAKFHDFIGADLPDETAAFMAASQTPTAIPVFQARVTHAAWRDTPSWAVVATEDRTVNPDLQRLMAERAGSRVTEVAASHAVYMTEPEAVAQVIETAAQEAD